jgi:hypothetical protein
VINERYLGDESAGLRFLREARSAARLRHSNVASVYAALMIEAYRALAVTLLLWRFRNRTTVRAACSSDLALGKRSLSDGRPQTPVVSVCATGPRPSGILERSLLVKLP